MTEMTYVLHVDAPRLSSYTYTQPKSRAIPTSVRSAMHVYHLTSHLFQLTEQMVVCEIVSVHFIWKVSFTSRQPNYICLKQFYGSLSTDYTMEIVREQIKNIPFHFLCEHWTNITPRHGRATCSTISIPFYNEFSSWHDKCIAATVITDRLGSTKLNRKPLTPQQA